MQSTAVTRKHSTSRVTLVVISSTTILITVCSHVATNTTPLALVLYTKCETQQTMLQTNPITRLDVLLSDLTHYLLLDKAKHDLTIIKRSAALDNTHLHTKLHCLRIHYVCVIFPTVQSRTKMGNFCFPFGFVAARDSRSKAWHLLNLSIVKA